MWQRMVELVAACQASICLYLHKMPCTRGKRCDGTPVLVKVKVNVKHLLTNHIQASA